MSITSPTRTALRSTRVLSTLPRAQLINKNKKPVLLLRKMSATDNYGVTPDKSNAPNFDFPERQPTSQERAMVDDILNLCMSLLAFRSTQAVLRAVLH